MSNLKINNRGFWESTDGTGHIHDSNLSLGILKYLKEQDVKNVFDFGCGMGDYAKNLISNGIFCEAYDGNPNTELLTMGLGKVLDLSENFDLSKKNDCVISLEVGEHIPKEHEDIFLNNICNHSSNLIILSWAIVGQTGDGHVNCQNNDYIINQMNDRGFNYKNDDSIFLRSCVTNAPWFLNTIMVFKKND